MCVCLASVSACTYIAAVFVVKSRRSVSMLQRSAAVLHAVYVREMCVDLRISLPLVLAHTRAVAAFTSKSRQSVDIAHEGTKSIRHIDDPRQNGHNATRKRSREHSTAHDDLARSRGKGESAAVSHPGKATSFASIRETARIDSCKGLKPWAGSSVRVHTKAIAGGVRIEASAAVSALDGRRWGRGARVALVPECRLALCGSCRV